MKEIVPKGIVVHALSEYVHRDGLKYYKRYNHENDTYAGLPLSEYPEWINFKEWLPLIRLGIHAYVTMNGEILPGNVEAPFRAAHAGRSFWNGLSHLNNHYLGVELVIPGKNSYGEFIHKINNVNVYTDSAYMALVNLCEGWVTEYDIPVENVVRHSDVSPGRKQDPGQSFAWGAFTALLDERV